MALKTIVKVGNVSNLSDARYCSGMGVQYLGFSLEKDNDNYVDPDTLKSIKEWVVGPEIVGEFFTSDPDAVKEAVEKYPIDVVQVTDIDVFKTVNTIGLPIILAFDVSTYQSADKLQVDMGLLKDQVAFFLLYKTDRTVLQKEDILTLAEDFKIMIGYGIDKDSLDSWLDNESVLGICLKGSIEIKPGFKDYDELADILEVLEMD
jgi:phosphoribosylanthranilate isomerase